MNERKHQLILPYPPDYVSAETLAYRLDCSRATIDSYVRNGLLPKPHMIGNLVRWDFGVVKAFIEAQNAPKGNGVASGLADPSVDAYLAGLERGSTG